MTNQTIPITSLSGPPVSRWFGFFSEFQEDSLGFLLRCHAYGDVVKLPMGQMAEVIFRHPDLAMYFLNHPDDVKHVLVTNQYNYTKSRVPPGESRVFGKGVIHTEGETHHHQRRLFLPFFHGDHVASYTGLITEKAAALATSWNDGATVDIGREMIQLTLSIMWRLLFGREVSSDATQVVEAMMAGHRLLSEQYSSVLAWIMPLWVPTTQRREFSRGQEFVDAKIRGFIQSRRATHHESQDMLALLLAATDEAGQPLNDQEIRDELSTFLIAGHDPTATALTWTWFLLSQFPTVRERLAHELETVLDHRLPTAADVPQLVYTKMIWDEALRGARSSNEPRVLLVRSSTTNPADLLASAFFQDGDGSGGYGKMIACSEWPIALRMASSASAIGGGPQRKITVSGPGGGRCPRRMASVMRPVPCDQPAGGCSNT